MFRNKWLCPSSWKSQVSLSLPSLFRRTSKAQEAKKLKLTLRRKKAESKRLLELEKRQKQRVEEMRKTQKKDVENMNLKEHLRVEVGKELSQLEMTCHDMSSVLCRLGIAVGHGTTHERKMSGVSLGESHGGPHIATKTLSKCNDGDGADVPESTPKKFRGNINVNENCITTQRERMKETSE